MLETYFAAPKTLERLCAGPSGPYMDGFAASLKRDGYRAATAVRYLRAAAHLGHFLQGRGETLANIDLSAFFQHLRTCRCPRSKGGRRNHHTSFGAKRYRDYLVQIGVCRCSVMPEIRCADPVLVVDIMQNEVQEISDILELLEHELASESARHNPPLAETLSTRLTENGTTSPPDGE